MFAVNIEAGGGWRQKLPNSDAYIYLLFRLKLDMTCMRKAILLIISTNHKPVSLNLLIIAFRFMQSHSLL